MAESAPVNDVLCSAVEYLVKLGANLRQRSETLKYKRIRKEKLKNTLAVQKAASKVLVLCELSKKSIVTVESSLNKILSQITTLQGKANCGKSSSSENISSYEYFEHDSRRLKIRKMVDLNHYTSAKVVASAMSTSLESKYDVHYDCKLFRLRKKAKSNEERHENSNKISEKNNSDTCKSVQFNDNIIICGKTQDESKDTCDTSSDGAKRTLNCKRSSENNLKKDKIPGYEDNPCSHMEQDSLQHNSDKMTTQDEIGKNGTESCTMNSSLNETLSEPDQVEKESDSANEVHLKNRKEQNNDQPQPEICSITNYDSDNQSEDSNSSMKSYIKCVNINSLLRPDIIPKVLSPVAIDSDSDDYPIKNPKPKRKSYKTYRNSKHQKEKVTHKFKPCKFKINITRLPKLTPQYLESKNLSRIIQNGTVICEVLQTTETNKSMFNSDKPNVDRDKIQLDDDILETKRSLLLNSDSDEDSRNVNELNKNALLCDADSDKVNPKETSPDNNRNNSIETTHTKEHIVDKDSEKSYNIDSITNKKKEEEETKLDSQRVLLTPDITKENDNDDDVDHATDSAEKETTECIETSASKEQKMLESAKKQMLVFSSSSSSDTDDELMKNVYENIRKNILREDSPEEDSTKRSDSESSKSNSSNTSSHNGKKTKKRKLTSKETEENRNSSKMDSNGKSSGSCDDTNNEDKALNGLTNLRTLKRSRRQRTEKRDRFRDYRMAKMPKVPVISDVDLLEPESSSDVPSPAANEDYEELPSISVPGLNGDDDTFAKEDLLGGSDTSASETENKNSQDDKANSEEENVKSKRRKANALSSGSEAGSSRRQGQRMSDFEDSEDDGSETMKRKRKKNKRTDEDSEGSGGSSDGKKKRRRIKNIDDSDGSGSETENEGRNKHGRKNIRKVMGKNQLEEATKKAAREEKERMARIAERQKLYNNLQFDESGKPDEVVLDKVVLDFDPDTKEPIIEVDKGLVKKLKPHQANGIKFMWDACFESVKRIKKGKGSGCILAHCMGLGKTLQVVSLTHTLLTHGDLTNVNRVLVVCPLSTVLNWVNEFKMWLKHSLTQYEVDVYELSRYKQNSDRAFQLSQWYQHGGVCVLGYEMFRNLSSDSNKKFKKKMLKNFQESLVDPGPDLVVCDEGHLLKNEKTSLSQAMNKVKTLRRIVLTGTPLQNNLKEYYCMVQFVKPNLLGKYNEYLNRFVNPITNGQYTDSTEHDIKIMKRRSHVLHKMLDGAVQRRDYGVLAPFLPPKHEYVLFITLNEVQVKLYTHYLDNYSRRPLPGKSSGFLFPDFQSLQRIWTHPLVLKYNSERYEIMQQKKREREEEDSEGSLVDFINDDSTPEETSTEESTDDSSDMSDDSRKKKKKKSPKKSKGRSTRRATRANPVEAEEDDVQEVIEVKNENPTEWWMSLVNEEELDDMRNSHKLVLLFDILRQCEAIGDKLLVFSQSLYSLDLIEHFLGKVDEATQEGRVDEKLGSHVGSWSPGVDYFRLDGSTSCENRSIWCKNFNREDNPRARLFLISTRAGGLGINLVAANRVVIFDVSWNPSHDVQSIFRVYRFGQKKPCYVYRFLVMGTMEEKIYERQVTKQAISKRVIDEQQIDRHYAENDLAELYKFEPQPPQPRPIPPLPKDRLFAEMLKEHEQLIYKYHEHDSLLENKEEETLTEEERKAAWEDFENEKTRPPPAVFAQPYAMHNGMMLAQQQQLAYAALAATLRKEAPTITENQIRDMIPLIYGANPQLMQKLGEMYKYPQSGMMNPGMMNAVMNSAAGGGSMSHSASTGLQYEPPWQRQQQMRLQQLMQQQNQMGAKFYAGGLGSRDPVAMALQHQRAREMMLGERTRPRGRPPHRDPAPRTNSHDVVNLDSD